MERSRVGGTATRERPEGPALGPQLVERDRQLSVLDRCLSEARDGIGSVVVVSGEAGVGKSTLLRVTAERARRDGLRLLVARGLETEQDFAFGLALRLIEPAVLALTPAEQDRLFDGPARGAAQVFQRSTVSDLSGGNDHAAAVLHAFTWLMRRLAGAVEGSSPAGLVLVVDDLQWADVPSARLLARLGALLDDLPLTIVLAVRDGGPAARQGFLEELTTLPWAVRLPLPRLSRDGVDRLVQRMLPGATDAFAAATLDRTGGNPLYVEQLLAVAAEDGFDGGAADVDRLGNLLPSLVRDRVGLLLQRLPADAVALAESLAVLGDETPLRLAAALAGASSCAAERSTEDLMSVGLLRAEEPLSFRHPLDRTAVHDRMSPPARSRAHRRAADVLTSNGAPVEAVGAHLLRCRADADPWVVEVLGSAAERAGSRGDYGVARRLLLRALAEPPESDAVRGRLTADLALTEVALGDPAAISRMGPALDLVEDPVDRAGLMIALARLQFTLSRFDAAAGSIAAAQAQLPAGHPLADEIVLDELLLAALIPGRQRGAAEEVHRRAPRVFAGTDVDAPAPLLAMVAATMLGEGRPAGDVRRVAAAALPGGSGQFSLLNVGQTVLTLLAVDEPDLAASAVEDTVRRAESDGSLIGLGFGTHWRAALRLHVGDLLGAIADAERNLDVARSGWGICRNWVVPLLATAQIELGHLDDAEAALRWGDDAHGVERALILEVRARLHLARGDAGAALECLSMVGALVEGNLSVLPSAVVNWRSLAAEAASSAGDRHRAGRLAADAVDAARRTGIRHTLGVALRAAGRVSGTGGDTAEGLALLAESVEVLRSSPARLEYAHSLVELGSALRRAGELPHSRDTLREGIGLAERSGAAPLVARAVDELRASGGRRSSARVAAGRHLLTVTEDQVVRLAAEGRATRQIAAQLYLSPKTVAWHLTNAYRKLGVSSRQQLSLIFGDSAADTPGRSAG